MTSNEIENGAVIINKEDGSIKFVTITQGQRSFFGRYEESPDGAFLVAFAEGHIARIADQESWSDGEILLAKSNNVLRSRRLERPNDCQVANNGNIVINDWLRYKEEPGGKIYVFGPNGEMLFERMFNTNLASCAISKDGTYAVASTFLPDNAIYLIDVKNNSVRWRIKNRASELAIGLSFSDSGAIDIFTGKNKIGKTYDYSLTLEGNLTDSSSVEFSKIEQARQSTGYDSIRLLIGFLTSTNTSEVLKGLDILSAKLSKKQKTNYMSYYMSY